MKNKFVFLFLIAISLIAFVQSTDSIQLLEQLEELENLQYRSAVVYAAYVDQFGRPLNSYNQILDG